MKIIIEKVDLVEILNLRNKYLTELNCQIRYDSCHERGWSDSYMIKHRGKPIGYASVKGRDELSARDSIFEFYLLRDWRIKSNIIFQQLIVDTGVPYLECQTNDPLTSQMVFELGKKLTATTILFADDHESQISLANAVVRIRDASDLIFEKNKDAGAYVLEIQGEVVASGGFLLHYNYPFADLYMETRHDRRNKGYASFLLQELKKHCYQSDRVPAARCRLNNLASKTALQKAGMRVCGYMLQAEVKSLH